MNKHLSKLMLCIALMCFGTINLKAASRYWVASSTSNWNNAANWSATNGGAGGAGVPTSEDDVYFTSSQNGSCNIDVNVDVNHMYSTSSYSGNLNVNTPAGTYSVMVRGNFSKTSGTGTFSLINVSSFTVMGAFSHNYYTFTAPSTTMYLGGAFNQTGGTFNHSNGTIVFNGNSATADMNSFTTVYNLTIAKNNGQTLTINSGDYFAVSNTTNYTDGLCATGSIYAYGDVIVGSGWDGGNASLVITGTANKAIDMTGAADKFAGNIDINKSGSYTTTLSSDVTLKTTNQTLTLTTGTLNLNGKTLTVWNNSTTGTVVGAGGFTISGTGTFNMYNYTQTASGTVALTGASTFRCYNNFSKSISSTAHFNCNAATFIVDGAFTNTAGTFWTSSTTTTIGGNFTHTGGTFSSTAGTVIFNGNSALADMNSFSSIYNLQINKNSGQTLTINTNDYFYVSNVLTLTDGLCSGGRFDAAGNVVVQSGWDGGTSSLTFLASAHTTFDATGASISRRAGHPGRLLYSRTGSLQELHRP
jgi:hypothetical protein